MEMRKIFGRIFAVAAVSAIILCGIHFMNYILVDDTESYTRLMMHEFYNQENIDILCLGGSHCYRGIDPSIVSEKTGKDVFLASSMVQEPDASYALLKEAIRLYDVKEVYLEISAAVAQLAGSYSDRTNLTNTYLVSDYMKPSANKLSLLLEASAPKYYINSMIPSRRYWSSVLDFKQIGSIIEKKSTDTYREYGYDFLKTPHLWYAGNGYVPGDEAAEEHKLYIAAKQKYEIAPERISDDWKNSINSIIDYCNDHNVKLTLYNSPISYFRLIIAGNFDDYIDFIRDFVEGRDVEYAEFNLLKEEYLPYRQSNYEKDGNHLNIYGGQEFSNFFAEYVNGNIPDDAYYGSIGEKLADVAPDFYGILYEDNKEENVRRVSLISNIPEYFEYRVEVTKSDGEPYLLQDFDLNDEIDIPKEMLAKSADGFKPRIVVTFRQSGSDDTGTRIEY